MSPHRLLNLSLASALLLTQVTAYAEDRSVGDAMAAAGFVTTGVATVGLIFVYRGVDKLAIARHQTLLDNLSRSELSREFLIHGQEIKRLNAEASILAQATNLDPVLKVTAHRKFKMMIDSHQRIRSYYTPMLLRSVARGAEFNEQQIAHMIRSKQTAVRRFETAMQRGYARTNPLYLVALGGSLLALAGTSTNLSEMTFAEVYQSLSTDDKIAVSEVLDKELSSQGQSLDSLIE